jgi:hypothetical protein
MYRLVQLLRGGGAASVYVDRDGYTSEAAAWVAYSAAATGFSGVGRFDMSGRLVEVVVYSVCGVDRAEDAFGLAACPDCGGTPVVDDLVRDLGVAVRPAPADVRRRALAARIAAELPGHVGDAGWRRWACAELAAEPGAADGVVDGVAVLADPDVLDLFPALQDLAAELPAAVRDGLRHAGGCGESPARVAAARLGLTAPATA